jgi:hypothetical protein
LLFGTGEEEKNRYVKICPNDDEDMHGRKPMMIIIGERDFEAVEDWGRIGKPAVIRLLPAYGRRRFLTGS